MSKATAKNLRLFFQMLLDLRQSAICSYTAIFTGHMTSKPLVSVIVAVRNGERFLEQSLNSIVSQGYEPIEILVVDGHSTDRTVEIAKSYDSLRIVPQVNRGIADAYNLGVQSANGDFIAFNSHDDIWQPEKLKAQVQYLLDHPEVAYCTGKVTFFLEPGYGIPAGFREELLEGEHTVRLLETWVVRKEVFKAIGPFDTSISTAEDVDWLARAGDQGFKSYSIPEVLVRKRVHDENSSLVPENNKNLLSVVRKSLERKRGGKES